MDQSQPCAPSSSSSSPTDGGLISICKLVLPLLHSQEFDKADSLMEDARLRYRDFPSILALLRITGVIQLFKSEFLEEDLCAPDALCCAKIATQLSPFNLECSFFFVKLLVSYYRRYKVAIKECERSLAVINPISDAAGYLRASNFQEVRHVTPEEGWINYYREQLRSFLITARDALIDENLPAQHQDQELYDSSRPVSREVMDTCERALALLHSNNFTKAGCLLQQANYRRHNSFAFFHRICALTHYYVYAHTRNKDLEAKKHWLQKAIASAERATILSPSNLEYSLFYVNLLICWGGIFPEVVKECERALAVTDPMDFFFERFLKDKTAKDRMAFYQHSLRSILKTHAVAFTSTDPPPSDEVKTLSDQAPQIPSQGDKPCPEQSSSLLAPTSTDPSPPSNEEKNLADEALPVCQQCEEPDSSPSIDSGKVKNLQEPCPSHSPYLPPVSTNAHPPPPSDVLKNLCKRALQVLHQDGPAKAQHVLNGVPHQHKSSAIFHRVRGLVLAMYAGKLTRDPECMLYNLRESLYSAHQATIISPNNLEFSVNYVRHLVSRRKYEEAEKECKRALAVTNPTDFLIECVSESSQETTATSRIALHQDHLQFHLHVIKRPNLSKNCKSILVTDGDVLLIRFHLQSLQTPTEWRDLLRVNVKDFKDRFKSTDIGDALCFGHENRSWKYWICPCCSDQEFNDSESMWQHMLKEHLREPSEELKSLFPKQIDQDWADELVKAIWEPIDIHAMTANDNLLRPLSADKERSRLLKLIKYNFWMLITNNCLSMSHIGKVLKYAMGEIQVLPSAQELENVQTGDQLIFSIRLLDSLQLKEVFDFLESLMKACKLGPYAESRGPSRDAFLDSPEDDIRIGVTLDDSLSYIDLNLEPLSSSENSSSPDGEARNTPDVNSVICWLYDDQNDKEKIKALAKEREVGADKIVENLQKEYSELYAVCGEKLLEYQDALKFLKNEIENEPGERTNSAEVPIEWKKELAKGEAFKESRNTDGSINQSDNGDENSSRTGSIYNSNTKSAFRKLEEPSNKKLCIVDAKIMKNLATIKQLKSNLERVCFVDYRAILVPLLRVYMQEALKRRIEEHSQRISEEASEASLKELLHDDEKDRDKRDFSPKQLQETSKDRKKSSNSKKSKGKNSR